MSPPPAALHPETEPWHPHEVIPGGSRPHKVPMCHLELSTGGGSIRQTSLLPATPRADTSSLLAFHGCQHHWSRIRCAQRFCDNPRSPGSDLAVPRFPAHASEIAAATEDRPDVD